MRSPFGSGVVAPIVIGALSAFGFFARFTLAFFGAPVVLLFLAERGKKRNSGGLMTRSRSRSRSGGGFGRFGCGVENKGWVSKKEDGAGPSCATSKIGASAPHHGPKAGEEVTEKRMKTATTLWAYCTRDIWSSWRNVLLCAWGFVPTAALTVTADAAFYHFLRDVVGSAAAETSSPVTFGLPALRSRSWSLGGILDYVAPLNALRYNSRVANLAEHGLHNRTNHLLVNLPMLFGPLAILFHADLLKMIILPFLSLLRCGGTSNCALTSSVEAKDDDEGEGVTTARSRRRIVRVLCVPPIISGLAALSLAPHQEPRFLLPLAVPLVALHGGRLAVAPSGHGGSSRSPSSRRSTSIFTFCWVVFNVALLTFFGVLHQGGVVPSVIRAGQITWPHGSSSDAGGTPTDSAVSVAPVTVVYYHTYMPPTFLLRGHRCAAAKSPQTAGAPAFGSSSDVEQEEWTTWDIVATKGPCNDRRGHRRTCRMAASSMIDLKGSSIEVLNATILSLLRCSGGSNHAGDDDFRHRSIHMHGAATARVYAVAPPQTLEVDVGGDRGWRCDASGAVSGARGLACRRLWSIGPHVTTEDFPPLGAAGDGKDDFRTSAHLFRRAFRLVLYEFVCARE